MVICRTAVKRSRVALTPLPVSRYRPQFSMGRPPRSPARVDGPSFFPL